MKKREHTRLRGFTLIELLVVLIIIVSITMIALASQGSFNKTFILANSAYDVALSLRFAETYGLGSRVLLGASTNTGYGLHFVKATKNSYTLFADTIPAVGTGSTCHPLPPYDATGPSAIAGNCAYNSGETIQQVYTLNNGITIKDFCAQASNNSWSCATTNGSTLTSLDIVFARPNPVAFITVNGSQTLMQAACITLTSLQGNFKYIRVAASGQINANSPSCP